MDSIVNVQRRLQAETANALTPTPGAPASKRPRCNDTLRSSDSLAPQVAPAALAHVACSATAPSCNPAGLQRGVPSAAGSSCDVETSRLVARPPTDTADAIDDAPAPAHDTGNTNDDGDVDGGEAVPAHPLGVLPSGAALLLDTDDTDIETGRGDRASLGRLAVLPDALLLDVLWRLPAAALARVARCCCRLYALAHAPDLWRALVLRRVTATAAAPLAFRSTWRQTYADNLWQDRQRRLALQGLASVQTEEPPLLPPPLSARGVCSDVLYEPWLAAAAPIQAVWLSRQSMARHDDGPLSASAFRTRYEEPGVPVLLGPAAAAGEWPALALWGTPGYVARGCGEARLEAFDEFVGALGLTWSDYDSYARQVCEERPLYVFEPRFQEKVPALAGDVSVPLCFEEDLLGCLGEAQRPDYRWLLRGPARTGTNFHVDPNYTAAWNTVILGRKRWLLFPPHVTPPGVAVLPDGTVQQPESVMAWFLRYYQQVHAMDPWRSTVVECTCGPGETVFIPAGWWHLVLNVKDTLAYTQNYVGRSNLPHTLAFLATGQPAHMTHAGPPDLHDQFVAALEAQHPLLLHQAQAAGAGKTSSLWSAWGTTTGHKEERGQTVVAAETAPASASGFSFGF